ncbi:hypothetical protein L3X38_003680 [Prunus dulcis]|uniref:DUF4218 domain-containing protein n=1 Tax=Prunus dulcis TaxID=3755 RepID=A0AAD4ZMG2_PRUDU|nr:hypothetical protein L3X38_003680 [Prunus dulcis]
MGVKTAFQPEYGERSTRLPPRPWNLSRAEKRAVCNSFYGMKVPEGCFDKRYIAKEAVEFCTEHLSDVSTVGVLSSQKMGFSKPLPSCTMSLVDWDLLNQAYLYVLENTEEVVPYIKEHMIHIKTTYPKFRKRTKWLQDKHKALSFNDLINFHVQSELNGEDNGLSENLSAMDKNHIVSKMGFYGVIQEIWDLDYEKFRIPVFREYNDVNGDDMLGEIIIECEPFTRGIHNIDTFDDLVGFGHDKSSIKNNGYKV